MDHEAMLARWAAEERVTNFGVAEVKRLAGNVGYIDLRAVTDAAAGGAAPTSTTSTTANRGRPGSSASLAWLPGPRYTDRPLYVLTSADTFSGGEEITYNLQRRSGPRSSARRPAAARTRRCGSR
jgi:hypothetical protein